MSDSVFEVPSGVVDSVNTLYVTSRPYRVGSLSVYLNGQLKRPAFDDGFLETSPSSGQFTMKEAPRVGDDVQVYYWDTAPDSSRQSVSPLRGYLSVKDELSGTLREKTGLRARLDPVL